MTGSIADVATNEVPRGPIYGYASENVRRLRAARNWSLAELSQRMTEIGWPMLTSGLHRIEQGKRQVNADDLVALAIAFDVTPVTLLMPFTAKGEVNLTKTRKVDAHTAWEWLRGLRPLELPEEREEALIAAIGFQSRALPLGARAIPRQLSEFFSAMEGATEEPFADWDAYDKRRQEREEP